MSDEKTLLESLSKLKMAGRLRYWRGTIEIPESELHAICDEIQAEHDQAIAATLGSGKAKDLLLRTFGLAQMMYDCWLEECKAGDNVDISACNAYSYEFDQVAHAMFDAGIDSNDSDCYRSAELGGTCKNIAPEYLDFLCSECGFVHYHSDENNSGDGNDWVFCPRCGRKVE